MIGPCSKKNRDICGDLPLAGKILENRLLYRNAKIALKLPFFHRKFINCLFAIAKG